MCSLKPPVNTDQILPDGEHTAEEQGQSYRGRPESPDVLELIKTDTREEGNVDLNKHKLPFDEKIFKEALRDTETRPNRLIRSEMLEWLESDSVLPFLTQWKASLVERNEHRLQLENAFQSNPVRVMIDILVQLCFEIGAKTTELPAEDAFEATAFTAVKIVHASNDVEDTPFTGVADTITPYCYRVAVSLLVTAFCDLQKKDGYFISTIGGEEVPFTSPVMFKAEPPEVNEVDGPHGMKALLNDFPWLEKY
ncbi:hypothetical protein LTR37_013416 [Vermiconidia calcicola]|uniref:Uncharacterized protein n=1 Tax=Vermiconidia calcicola TaxID=1690605 RepID=A0ACC3MWP8_9PEZI|nr:hypothetical protein LTR37_013416 [Vermiconidia calcicola]